MASKKKSETNMDGEEEEIPMVEIEEEEEERWGRGGRREGELVFRRVGGRVAEAEAIKARLPDRGAHLGRGADREG